MRKRKVTRDLARKRELEAQAWGIICEAVASRKDANAWLMIPIPGALRKELADLWRRLEHARENN